MTTQTLIPFHDALALFAVTYKPAPSLATLLIAFGGPLAYIAIAAGVGAFLFKRYFIFQECPQCLVIAAFAWPLFVPIGLVGLLGAWIADLCETKRGPND